MTACTSTPTSTPGTFRVKAILHAKRGYRKLAFDSPADWCPKLPGYLLLIPFRPGIGCWTEGLFSPGIVTTRTAYPR